MEASSSRVGAEVSTSSPRSAVSGRLTLACGSSRASAGMRIAELAALTGSTVRALRYYEDAGLITPERTSGNIRIYGPIARHRAQLIVDMRSLGLSLEEIADGLKAKAEETVLIGLLKDRLQVVRRQANRLADMIEEMEPKPGAS